MWMPIARYVRCSAGWQPPMLLVAAMGVAAFCRGFIGNSIIATSCLYVWAACWGTAFLLSSSLALADSTSNLVRFRLRGWTRSRFWFEIARSSCILGVMASLLTLLIGVAGLPFTTFVGDLLVRTIIPCFVTFCVASTLGYFTMVVARRPVLGRARQCVDFFYPQCLACLVVTTVVFLFRTRLDNPWSYGPALAVLIATCLLAALTITLIGRLKRELPPSTENTP